jgi:hypothetical protein
MKQTPELQQAQARMRPGLISRDGFLGDDMRPLSEIIDQDESTVHSLGLTHRQIADRMEYFTERGKGGLGTTVDVDDRFHVRVETVRGVIPCPWGHRGLYPKVNVWFRNMETGEEMTWTALSIHLIRAHGFYEGRGSTFRVDPGLAKRALEL